MGAERVFDGGVGVFEDVFAHERRHAHVGVKPAAFIHRDYHPGNTLWVAGRLTAIVDWTSASWGPPAVDVAHMRANLAMSHGVEAADEFLEAYRAVAGPYAYDPYWDLRVAVDFLPELTPGARPEFERLDEFVTRAAAAL